MATAAELLILIKGKDEASGTIDHVTGRLGSFKQMAQTAAGTFAGFLSAQAAVGVMRSAWDAAAGSIIGFNSQMEQARIGFTTMLGSGEKANAFLKDLQQFAAQTPFEFPELVSASQKMLAMGFSAEKVRPMLTAVGDAVAALGGNGALVDRVTTALGQMQAKGKVSAEEMLQLTEAGIPAWQMLADAIGVDVPTAMKMAEKGAINSATAIDAITAGMNQRFGGMMAKQSQTFAGAMSTIKDSLNIAVGAAFKPFFDLLSRGAVQLSGFLSSDKFAAWSAAATAAVGGLIGHIAGLTANLGPLAAALMTAFREDLLPKLQQIADVFASRVLPAVQALAAEIASRLAPVFERVINFVGEHKEIWGGVAVAIGGALVAAFAALAVAAGSAAVSVIAATAPIIAIGAAVAAVAAGVIWLVKNWDDLTARYPLLGKAAEAVAGALSKTWEFIRGEVQAFADWWSGIWPMVQEAAVNVWNAVRTVAETITGAILAFWRAAGDDIMAIIGAFADYIKTTWDNIKTIVSNAIELVLNLINGNWSAAWENAKAIVGAFVSQVKAYVIDLPLQIAPHLLSLAKKFLSWIADDVVPFLAGALADITVGIGKWLVQDAIPWAGKELAKLGKAIIDAIRDGISAAWDGFTKWFNGLLDRLLDAAKDRVKGFFNSLNPFGKTAASGGSSSEDEANGEGESQNQNQRENRSAGGSPSAGAPAAAQGPAETRRAFEDIAGGKSVRGQEVNNFGGVQGLSQTTLTEGDWEVVLYNASASLLAASSQFLDIAKRGANPAGTDLMTAAGFTSTTAFNQWLAAIQKEAQESAMRFATAQGAMLGTTGGGRTAGDIMAGMRDAEFEEFLNTLPASERDRARAERQRWQEEQAANAGKQQQAADWQSQAAQSNVKSAEQEAVSTTDFSESVDEFGEIVQNAGDAAEEAVPDVPEPPPDDEDDDEGSDSSSAPAHDRGGVITEFARLVNAAGRTIGTMSESGPEAIVPMPLLRGAMAALTPLSAPGPSAMQSPVGGEGVAVQIGHAVAAALAGVTVEMDGQTVGRLVSPYVSREIARDALLAGVNR